MNGSRTTRLEERKWRRGRAKRVASARMHDITQILAPAMKFRDGLAWPEEIIKDLDVEYFRKRMMDALDMPKNFASFHEPPWDEVIEYAEWCRPNDEASARRGYDGQLGQRDSARVESGRN